MAFTADTHDDTCLILEEILISHGDGWTDGWMESIQILQ
jgi:hypothetical protein